MNRTPTAELTCPYCDRPLRWVPLRWFGRGCFECERCGEFPDLRDTGSERDSQSLHDRDTPIPATNWRDRPRVLIVDDSVEHCDLCALMLDPAATVVTASRGEAALAIAATEPLDAIVLDVLMPGMDGWEVCSCLKSDPKTSEIPVIMLTSLDATEVDARARRAGAAAVLMKPCTVECLALVIDAAVRGRLTSAAQMSGAAGPGAYGSGMRRWTRKPVTMPIPARLDRLPAHLLNISYGGLCVQVEGAGTPGPTSFDVTFPSSNFSIHAGAVWMSRGNATWLCGVEVEHGDQGWRNLVNRVL